MVFSSQGVEIWFEIMIQRGYAIRKDLGNSTMELFDKRNEVRGSRSRRSIDYKGLATNNLSRIVYNSRMCLSRNLGHGLIKSCAGDFLEVEQ